MPAICKFAAVSRDSQGVSAIPPALGCALGFDDKSMSPLSNEPFPTPNGARLSDSRPAPALVVNLLVRSVYRFRYVRYHLYRS